MMRTLRWTVGSAAVLAFLAVAVLAPQPSEARCGTMRDGTLNLKKASCPPPAADCTETWVCDY